VVLDWTRGAVLATILLSTCFLFVFAIVWAATAQALERAGAMSRRDAGVVATGWDAGARAVAAFAWSCWWRRASCHRHLFEPRAFFSFPPSGFSLRCTTGCSPPPADGQSGGEPEDRGLGDRPPAWRWACRRPSPAVRGRFPSSRRSTPSWCAPDDAGMVIGIAMLFFGAYFAFRASNRCWSSAEVFCLPFVIRITMARLAGWIPSWTRLGQSRAGKLHVLP